MATTLPRGILLAKYKLADGSTAVRYRVRIKRADFKADKYFDNIPEAKAFLQLSKLKRGKAIIYDLDERKEQAKVVKAEAGNYTFEHFVALYKQQYLPESEVKTELQRRNWNNKVSFLKTIVNTMIQNRYMTSADAYAMGMDTELEPGPYYSSFGKFDIRKIKNIEINAYVNARLKKVKKISVQREITFISNIFTKLQYLREDLADLPNPTFTYDKTLTENAVKKRHFTYSEDDEKLLFDTLSKVKNRTYFDVAKISFLTGLRRSEVLMLTKQSIHQNSIFIELSKGKSRTIYLTPEAKDYINALPYNKETGRFFSLTIGGFEKMFREICDRKEETKHLKRFHDIRRTNISRLITKIGLENSVILSQILGISNVANLEKSYEHVVEKDAPKTQKEALKNFGHSYAQTTLGYFNFNAPSINFNIKK